MGLLLQLKDWVANLLFSFKIRFKYGKIFNSNKLSALQEAT